MSLHLGEEGEQRLPFLMSAATEEIAGLPSGLHRQEELSMAPSGPVAAQELEPGIDLEDVMYSANSFSAVMKPVALTMFLASIVVVNVDFGEATGSDSQGMSVYQVNSGDQEGGGDSNSVKLGKSLANALIIVGAICCATFLVACLYRFRCMKVLVGYMALSCILLLGLMGGLLWETALIRWELPCDKFTFYFALYNFAAVGVTAIFYQKGIPTVVTQAYLVAISVIMSWQLSRFEEWTGWSLLVMLALYDLCAVLTPCGPLKYLVGLMQEYNEPMPGLLYEAELPGHNPPPGSTTDGSTHGRQPRGPAHNQGSAGLPASVPLTPMASHPSSHAPTDSSAPHPPHPHHHHHHHPHSIPDASNPLGPVVEDVLASASTPPRPTRPLDPGESPRDATPLLSNTHPAGQQHGRHPSHLSGQEGTREQENGDEGGQQGGEEEEGELQEERSIKLGLGDFVFYSVLVSKAALYGFATCAACFLVIITGLGATLVLLSVFRKALPALPISIGLGVIFYLLTRLLIIPYIANLAAHPFYV